MQYVSPEKSSYDSHAMRERNWAVGIKFSFDDGIHICVYDSRNVLQLLTYNESHANSPLNNSTAKVNTQVKT